MRSQTRSRGQLLRPIDEGAGSGSLSAQGVQLAREPTGELQPASPGTAGRLKRPRDCQSSSRTDGTPEQDEHRPQRSRPLSVSLDDTEPEAFTQSAQSALVDDDDANLGSGSLEEVELPLSAEQISGSPARALTAAGVLQGSRGSPNCSSTTNLIQEQGPDQLPATYIAPVSRRATNSESVAVAASSSVSRATAAIGEALPMTPAGASSSRLTAPLTQGMPSVGSAERRAGAALASAVQETRRLAAEAGMRVPELQGPNEVAAAHKHWEAAQRAMIHGVVSSKLALRSAQEQLAARAEITATPFKPGPLARPAGDGGRAGLASVLAMHQQSSASSTAAAALSSGVQSQTPSKTAQTGSLSQSATRLSWHPETMRGVLATVQVCSVLEQSSRTLPAVSEASSETAGDYADHYRVSRRAAESVQDVLEDMGYARFREMQRRINACNATGRMTTSQFCNVLASGPVLARSDAAKRWRAIKAEAIGGMLMGMAPMQQLVAKKLARAAAATTLG